jgi:hypothetical protein
MTNKNREEKSQDIKWDVQSELALFTAMAGHRPVGKI